MVSRPLNHIIICVGDRIVILVKYRNIRTILYCGIRFACNTNTAQTINNQRS